ncbi:hypothetical protein [Acinetobacter sp. NRRL B-65365]|uniref:hypothetical protein n=1 Tax=Acinetobacter sp. NRRL B-65365 TaxID=1785092 RepID=UPI00201808B4|nr:hypothetical protein [Acinetobacter sp. NRRL B-65365]
MNKTYIILGISFIFMFGVIWKSNHDRLNRELEKQEQFQQHTQKMAEMEVEQQVKLQQEAAEKTKRDQQRAIDNENARLETERFEREMKEQELARSREYASSNEEEDPLRHIYD